MEPPAPTAAGAEPPVRRAGEDRGLVAVLGLVAVWCAVMYAHVWWRHDRFGTFDNDLGFHDQYVWLLARGRSFSTVLGLTPFGHNATFGYFLLVPLSWLGLGPHGLNAITTLAVGLGAVPVYLLARDRLGAGRAVPFALAWLLHPVVQGNVWETFHPEALAMAPLLAAYLCATRRRWRPFAAWVLLALIWKSDVSLAVAMLGLVILLWSHPPRAPAAADQPADAADAADAADGADPPNVTREADEADGRRRLRRVGAATTLVGLLWFAVTVGWMIPTVSGGGTVFGPLYGDLGETPADVAATALRDPGKVIGRIVDHEPVRYARDLLAPYGFVPVVGGLPLLLAAPQAVVNLLSVMPFTREWGDNAHYQALPVVALTLALVEGAAWLDRRRPGWSRPVGTLVVASSLAATVAWGSLWPFATQAAHYWPSAGNPTLAAKREAVDLIPPDAPVTAHYLLVPHLTHREIVYSFPNPWRRVFYGVKDTPLPDPAGVEFLAMEPALLNDVDREVWDCITPSFRTVYERDGIVVARRIPGSTEDRACQEW